MTPVKVIALGCGGYVATFHRSHLPLWMTGQG